MKQIERCDALAVHTYWSPGWPMLSHPDAGVGPVDYAHDMFPDMTIFISECSHNGGGVDETSKAESLLQFWVEMKKRDYVAGLAHFVLSATNPHWQHNKGSGEIVTNVMAEVWSRR
jgi:hypothetical protein